MKQNITEEINYQQILDKYQSQLLLYFIFNILATFVSTIFLFIALFDKNYGEAIAMSFVIAASIYFIIAFIKVENSIKKSKKKR